MIDKQQKILKVMQEATTKMDMVEFSEKTGLTNAEIVGEMQALAKEGFVKKVGGGYTITEKAKAALKATEAVPWNMRFTFYIDIGQPTGMSAGSVKDFQEIVSKVNIVSLEFHLYRGDFENWFTTTVSDKAFADILASLKKSKLEGEELRRALQQALEDRYSIK